MKFWISQHKLKISFIFKEKSFFYIVLNSFGKRGTEYYMEENILANKNNSTIAIKNKDKKHSIINCQIKPLHKKYLRISERPIQNPQKKVQIQTMRNSIEKKKMVFNGITKDVDKNKTRNNPINHKPKQNSNLSISIKPIFQRKKIVMTISTNPRN